MLKNRWLNPLCYNKYSSTIYALQYYKEYYKVTVYSKSNFPTSFNLTALAMHGAGSAEHDQNLVTPD